MNGFRYFRYRDVASPTGLSCPQRAQRTGQQEAPMGTNGSFGSVRKLPSGRYQVRYFHLGKRISADSTFATKADARVLLAGVETDLKRGSYVDSSAGWITFGDYAGWWIEQRPLRPPNPGNLRFATEAPARCVRAGTARPHLLSRRSLLARSTVEVRSSSEHGVEDLPTPQAGSAPPDRRRPRTNPVTRPSPADPDIPCGRS
jgi:hypothetical protein